MLKNPVKRHYFTLVELLVAMVLLSVMMLLMVELSNQSQQLWRSTEHATRAYENSRTAFDQLERDINLSPEQVDAVNRSITRQRAQLFAVSVAQIDQEVVQV